MREARGEGSNLGSFAVRRDLGQDVGNAQARCHAASGRPVVTRHHVTRDAHAPKRCDHPWSLHLDGVGNGQSGGQAGAHCKQYNCTATSLDEADALRSVPAAPLPPPFAPRVPKDLLASLRIKGFAAPPFSTPHYLSMSTKPHSTHAFTKPEDSSSEAGTPRKRHPAPALLHQSLGFR